MGILARLSLTLGDKRMDLADLALDCLACTAWHFEPNRITFSRQPTKEESSVLLAYLHTTGNQFWIGDALAQLWKERDAECRADRAWLDAARARHVGAKCFDEETAIARRVHSQVSAVAKLNFDDGPKAVEAMKVCQTLGEYRCALSWQHHRDAVAETGRDREQAIEWLQQAEANGWSVAELRAHIRIANSASKTASRSEQKIQTVSGVLRKTGDAVEKIVQARPIDQWSIAEMTTAINAADKLLKMFSDIEARYRLYYTDYRILGK